MVEPTCPAPMTRIFTPRLCMIRGMGIDAVVFDMDGLLLDSEQVWDDVRETLARERGGRWHDRAAAGHDGDELARVVAVHARRDRARRFAGRDQRRGRRAHGDSLPGGAAPATRCGRSRRANRRPLAARPGLLVESLAHRPRARAGGHRGTGSASRSPPRRSVAASPRPTSTSKLPAGSASTRRSCAAVEDSHNGILAARAAGMRVVAVPNASFPPGDEALAAADVVLPSLAELVPSAIDPGPAA